MCVSFHYFPDSQKKLSQPPNLELDSLLSRFYSSVRTKKSMNGVYKTNIDCSFIRGMVENYCTLGKTQPQAYYSPRPYGPWWIVGLGWVSPRDNNFPPFPSWAVNICIIMLLLLPKYQNCRIIYTCNVYRGLSDFGVCFPYILGSNRPKWFYPNFEVYWIRGS